MQPFQPPRRRDRRDRRNRPPPNEPLIIATHEYSRPPLRGDAQIWLPRQAGRFDENEMQRQRQRENSSRNAGVGEVQRHQHQLGRFSSMNEVQGQQVDGFVGTNEMQRQHGQAGNEQQRHGARSAGDGQQRQGDHTDRHDNSCAQPQNYNIEQEDAYGRLTPPPPPPKSLSPPTSLPPPSLPPPPPSSCGGGSRQSSSDYIPTKRSYASSTSTRPEASSSDKSNDQSSKRHTNMDIQAPKPGTVAGCAVAVTFPLKGKGKRQEDQTMTEGQMLAKQKKERVMTARLARMTGILTDWDKQWEAASSIPGLPGEAKEEEEANTIGDADGSEGKESPVEETAVDDGKEDELLPSAANAIAEFVKMMDELDLADAPAVTKSAEAHLGGQNENEDNDAKNPAISEPAKEMTKSEDTKVQKKYNLSGCIISPQKDLPTPTITTTPQQNPEYKPLAPPTVTHTAHSPHEESTGGVPIPEEFLERDNAETKMLQLRAKIPWLVEQRGINGAGWRVFEEYDGGAGLGAGK